MKLNSISNPFSLEDKVIILTGGMGFLGQQYSEALIQAGAYVIIFDNKIEKVGAYLNDKCTYVQVDVTSQEQVKDAVSEVFNKFGKIDSLINNAAMNPAVGNPESVKLSGPYEDHPIDLWRKEVDVNLTGMQICIQTVVPYMMKSKQGTIVNIASEISVMAYDWTDVYPAGKFKSLAYIATKHGVVGLTKGWAAYLGPYGIRVNSFSPGGMQTDHMSPEFVVAYGKKNMLRNMAQKNDYNAHIIFLCSPASARMTGHNLIADGGKSAW